MVEQMKSIDYQSRNAKFIEKVHQNTLNEVLSILDAIVYWKRLRINLKELIAESKIGNLFTQNKYQNKRCTSHLAQQCHRNIMKKNSIKNKIKKELRSLFRSMDFVSDNFLNKEGISKKESQIYFNIYQQLWTAW